MHEALAALASLVSSLESSGFGPIAIDDALAAALDRVTRKERPEQAGDVQRCVKSARSTAVSPAMMYTLARVAEQGVMTCARGSERRLGWSYQALVTRGLVALVGERQIAVTAAGRDLLVARARESKQVSLVAGGPPEGVAAYHDPRIAALLALPVAS